MLFEKEADNYTLYGALFGLCFPLGAIGLELILRDLDFSLAAIVYLHKEVLLLWMIDSAPFVLGIFARMAGMKQDTVEANLANMQAVIAERTKHLEESKKQTEQELQMRAQLNELSQITTRANSSEDVARLGLAFMADISDSQVGATYLAENKKLKLLATYAYAPDEESKLIAFGESLLGQCAQEQKAMSVKALPSSHLKIQSSVGEAQASFIAIVPMIFEEQLLGLFELGAFSEYNEEKMLLLKKCAEIISISLNSALSKEKLSSLLAQST